MYFNMWIIYFTIDFYFSRIMFNLLPSIYGTFIFILWYKHKINNNIKYSKKNYPSRIRTTLRLYFYEFPVNISDFDKLLHTAFISPFSTRLRSCIQSENVENNNGYLSVLHILEIKIRINAWFKSKKCGTKFVL